MKSDDLSPYSKYVPEGCMPIFGIMVFGYIDEEGDVCGGWHYDGEAEMAGTMTVDVTSEPPVLHVTLFGHMEMAKYFFANQSYRETGDDE